MGIVGKAGGHSALPQAVTFNVSQANVPGAMVALRYGDL